MTTPRKGWPRELTRERDDLIAEARKLHDMVLVTWEYGLSVPERNLAFLRSMVPMIQAKAAKIRRLALHVSREASGRWHRTLIWALSETISEMEKLEIQMKLVERKINEQYDYVYPFDVFADQRFRDTAMRVLDAIDEVPYEQ